MAALRRVFRILAEPFANGIPQETIVRLTELMRLYRQDVQVARAVARSDNPSTSRTLRKIAFEQEEGSEESIRHDKVSQWLDDISCDAVDVDVTSLSHETSLPATGPPSHTSL